ncbi:hypothetical protein EIK77_000029 [Talaromyces pinophilus]|nr:hypothetical protein EIK77_000029 [Talaromyces pinophilus]
MDVVIYKALSPSYEAAGQQVAGSPHSTILLDGSLSPGEDHGNQSPFNAVTQGDTIQNPIETDDGKDSQPDSAYDDIRSHCHLLDNKIRLLERRLFVSDEENKELRQQNEDLRQQHEDLRQQHEDLRQMVEDMEQEIQDVEQENDELKAYKHLHPEVSEEHHGAAM